MTNLPAALKVIEELEADNPISGDYTLFFLNDLERVLTALCSDPEPECTCVKDVAHLHLPEWVNPKCRIHGVAKSPTTGAGNPGHTDPSDGTLMVFGDLIWEWITEDVDRFFSCEYSEDLMELAQKCQMVERVKYNPEIHGEIAEAEPGDLIWYWGERSCQPASTGADKGTVVESASTVLSERSSDGPDRSAQPDESGELKPCPFCGGKAGVDLLDPNEESSGYVPSCLNEDGGCAGVIYRSNAHYGTRAQAVAAWNTRVTPAQDKIVTGIHTMATAILAEVQEAARMRKFVMGHPSLYRGESQGLTAKEKLLVLEGIRDTIDIVSGGAAKIKVARFNQVIDRLREATK